MSAKAASARAGGEPPLTAAVVQAMIDTAIRAHLSKSHAVAAATTTPAASATAAAAAGAATSGGDSKSDASAKPATAAAAASVLGANSMELFQSHHQIMLRACESAAGSLPPISAAQLTSLTSILEQLKTCAIVFGWLAIHARVLVLQQYLPVLTQELGGCRDRAAVEELITTRCSAVTSSDFKWLNPDTRARWNAATEKLIEACELVLPAETVRRLSELRAQSWQAAPTQEKRAENAIAATRRAMVEAMPITLGPDVTAPVHTLQNWANHFSNEQQAEVRRMLEHSQTALRHFWNLNWSQVETMIRMRCDKLLNSLVSTEFADPNYTNVFVVTTSDMVNACETFAPEFNGSEYKAVRAVYNNALRNKPTTKQRHSALLALAARQMSALPVCSQPFAITMAQLAERYFDAVDVIEFRRLRAHAQLIVDANLGGMDFPALVNVIRARCDPKSMANLIVPKTAIGARRRPAKDDELQALIELVTTRLYPFNRNSSANAGAIASAAVADSKVMNAPPPPAAGSGAADPAPAAVAVEVPYAISGPYISAAEIRELSTNYTPITDATFRVNAAMSAFRVFPVPGTVEGNNFLPQVIALDEADAPAAKRAQRWLQAMSEDFKGCTSYATCWTRLRALLPASGDMYAAFKAGRGAGTRQVFARVDTAIDAVLNCAPLPVGDDDDEKGARAERALRKQVSAFKKDEWPVWCVFLDRDTEWLPDSPEAKKIASALIARLRAESLDGRWPGPSRNQLIDLSEKVAFVAKQCCASMQQRVPIDVERAKAAVSAFISNRIYSVDSGLMLLSALYASSVQWKMRSGDVAPDNGVAVDDTLRRFEAVYDTVLSYVTNFGKPAPNGLSAREILTRVHRPAIGWVKPCVIYPLRVVDHTQPPEGFSLKSITAAEGTYDTGSSTDPQYVLFDFALPENTYVHTVSVKFGFGSSFSSATIEMCDAYKAWQKLTGATISGEITPQSIPADQYVDEKTVTATIRGTGRIVDFAGDAKSLSAGAGAASAAITPSAPPQATAAAYTPENMNQLKAAVAIASATAASTAATALFPAPKSGGADRNAPPPQASAPPQAAVFGAGEVKDMKSQSPAPAAQRVERRQLEPHSVLAVGSVERCIDLPFQPLPMPQVSYSATAPGFAHTSVPARVIPPQQYFHADALSFRLRVVAQPAAGWRGACRLVLRSLLVKGYTFTSVSPDG